MIRLTMFKYNLFMTVSFVRRLTACTRSFESCVCLSYFNVSHVVFVIAIIWGMRCATAVAAAATPVAEAIT